MKIAVSGKGGVGKTTFAAFMIKSWADQGKKVIAIDADPDANLALALGIEGAEEITPISRMKELIEERTETKLGTMGGFFKINPKVNDLPEKLSINLGNIKLMVMGGVKKGGSGCICPESVMLKRIVSHIVLARDEMVVMDMEAGLEHLGRGTAMSVNHLIIVVEPGKRSIETARQIKKLSADLRIKSLSVVGNKIHSDREKEFILNEMKDFNILGFIPYKGRIAEADLSGKAVFENDPETLALVSDMIKDL